MTDLRDDREDRLRNLIRVHGRTVRACLARLERDPASVDDLWVDVFALASERLDELAPLPDSTQRSWLVRTASNLTANHARKNNTRRKTLETLRRDPLPFVPSAEEDAELRLADAESELRSDALRAALDMLEPAARQVLVLHAIGYDGPRIAAEMSISQAAARKRLMRARFALRQAYVDPVVHENATRAQP
ncbi:MAG TPA: sigma-70 family RNA polymerase sigma factor [Ilumatobacteraceae bacterium]|nr:sigma-70 family RNA polymerase sigma factor [Ilumatobacteraceae bacterium]